MSARRQIWHESNYCVCPNTHRSSAFALLMLQTFFLAIFDRLTYQRFLYAK